MPDFSIICAIEAGKLEAQTVLMLSSLKRFGGALASAKVVALQGRSGPRIARATQQALEDLGAEYVVSPNYNRASWFNYSNKIAAVEYAEEKFSTPWCIWLDADILFLREPRFARTQDYADLDFVARFEYTAPAEIEGDQTDSEYWRRVLRICGVAPEAVDFHDLEMPAVRMKPYFNSGVMLWRKQTGFARRYAQNFYRIVAARISPVSTGPWFADQVALTPTLAALGLRWRMLDVEDHLMLFAHHLDNPAFVERLQSANLVHYSKARDTATRSAFDSLVVAQVPDLQGLFDAAARVVPNNTLTLAMLAEKAARRARQKFYAWSSTRV